MLCKYLNKKPKLKPKRYYTKVSQGVFNEYTSSVSTGLGTSVLSVYLGDVGNITYRPV